MSKAKPAPSPRKTIRSAADLMAYLERMAERDGPKSTAAVMHANARAKSANPAHRYDPNILHR